MLLRRPRPPARRSSHSSSTALLLVLSLVLLAGATAAAAAFAPSSFSPLFSRRATTATSRSSSPRRLPSSPQPTTPTAPLFSAAAAAAAPAAPATDDSGTDAPFDWWRQWYPIALIRDLDANKPTKATLLGRELVLWKEGGANNKGGPDKGEGGAHAAATTRWRCFLDRCPHRLAPLSEGRIDSKTGHLQCAYHGWEFDAAGACTKIPQVDPEQPEPNPALQSRRACTTALPALEAQGMLWVWPDPSPDGLAASRATRPALMDGVPDEDMGYLVVAREMPYGFDTLLENGIDPSHLPWAHHNIISHRSQAAFIDIKVDAIRRDGFDSADFFPRRKRPSPTPAPAAPATDADDDDKEEEEEEEEEERDDGTKRQQQGRRRKAPAMIPVPQSLHFRPPALLYQVINVTEVLNKLPFLPKRERVIRIVTYAVPVAPGRSKVMYRFLRNYFLPPKPLRWLRWPPEWVEHLRILRVLDSDTVFLHGQERELRLLAGDGPQAVEIDRAYYMPTPADGSVRALRRWIQRFGGPKWLVPGLASTLPPLERDRRRLLDRYDSHTKHCKVCRGAMVNLRRLRHFIGFLSVMAFYLGLLGQSIYTRLAGGFLTVLGLTGALVIRKWERLFVFQDWDHSKNN